MTVIRLAEAPLPLESGEFLSVVYQNLRDRSEHLALIRPLENSHAIPLVRIHSECITGDSFGSLRCDCGPQLQAALRAVAKSGGAVLYLRQEGRGIGLANKIRAYVLQDQGLDTVEANIALGFSPDQRDYSIAVDILHELNWTHIRLLTNNPEKIKALEDGGIQILSREPLELPPSSCNRYYLQTKRDKLGHYLQLPEESL